MLVGHFAFFFVEFNYTADYCNAGWTMCFNSICFSLISWCLSYYKYLDGLVQFFYLITTLSWTRIALFFVEASGHLQIPLIGKNNGEGAGNGDLLEKILLLVKNNLTSEHIHVNYMFQSNYKLSRHMDLWLEEALYLI